VARRADSGIIGVTETNLAEAQRAHRFREAFYSWREGVPCARMTRPREGASMSLKGPKLEKFKQRLLAKRRELISEVRGSNVGSLEANSDRIQDIADQASSAYTKEFLLSIGDAERRMLRQVDEALNKIRQETYGLCESCGEMINERRLEALPFARLCITCQEEEERAKAGR
jgi:DnaK suppressor protein